jgi:imidazoleglycerol-phosphate dehydratase
LAPGARRPIEDAEAEDAMRQAELTRETTETRIAVSVNLDGTGTHELATGVGFFDHMLAQLSRHSLIDMRVRATGDLHIDDHHTVEDVGILLGRALAQALGDKSGIRRYGACLLPMDEALTRAALDLSGRPFLVWSLPFPTQKIGAFDTELVREFFTGFAMNSGMTLHVEGLAGANSHHIAESAFKAVARALREAVEPDPRAPLAPPSTKGTLSA